MMLQRLCAATAAEGAMLRTCARSFATSLPKTVPDSDLPTIKEGRQAFEGDLRSTSALGIGDGIQGHTAKWLQASSGNNQSPMEMLQEEAPKKVRGLKVASHGGDTDDLDGLGSPTEFIDLRGTTFEHPAVCKYTGNKFYSDDWKQNEGATH